MATTLYSKIDEYGFERSSTFNYETHGEFMSSYLTVLSQRNQKWSKLISSKQKLNKTGLIGSETGTEQPNSDQELRTSIQKLKKTDLLKRYVRKGVPSRYRKEVWMNVSGAQKEMSSRPDLYTILRQKEPSKSIVDIIKIDVPRTFPDNIEFNRSIKLPEQLFNVLVAYAHHNTEVGYCQGLNYIVGLILLATKDEEITFWLLKILVEDILPKYYINSMSGLITDIEVMAQLIAVKEPDVYRHLQNMGVPWAVVTTKWFICLFAEVLPTETVLRIWDCLFYEGSKILFRVAITLIRVHRAQILECADLAALVDCFKAMMKGAYAVKCHDFMEDIFKVPGSLSNRTITKLRLKHANAKVTPN